jgi:serine/threonine protein phosphatase PrpC
MSVWQRFVGLIQPNVKQEPMSNLEETKEQLWATGEFPLPRNGEEPTAGSLDLEICLQTDLGMVRRNNEDRGIYKRPSDPEVAAAKGTLIIVADGMGGASAGEVASEMAVKIIPEAYYSSPKAPALALKEAVESASGEIHRTAQTDPELRGMGTTCVAMAVLLPEVFVAYVGDSRLYLLRDDSFYQLTEDHTVVNEMVRKGIITRDQARHHEERNVLSMSMGGRPEITASYWEKPMLVRAGDRLLVCSDGLHDLVGDLEMQAIITDSPAHRAVQNLIEAAKRNGGHDNITAALVHVYIPKIQSETDFKATRELLISSE